jgi:hypothetical protein
LAAYVRAFILPEVTVLTLLLLIPSLSSCVMFAAYRATAIEMVTGLAQSQHGRQHLAQQGVMDKISNMIKGANTDPCSSLYLPGESQMVGLSD